MDKIICDICGTSYPSTADCCPICGCTNAAAEELLAVDIQSEELPEEVSVSAAQIPVNKKKKEIFDFDEVNSPKLPEEEDEEDEEADYDEEEDEEPPRHNTFVVILLTVLIVVLLGAAAFIFVRYFLPNMGGEETVPTTVATQAAETTASTGEPTVPCEQMFMTSAGVAELNAQGQQFLLHIKVLPENTTDKIIYTSGDESIATVTEDGKITAVSEGETMIYISCGEYFIDCPVIVKYVEETVPPTTAAEETVPPTTEAQETEPAEAGDPAGEDDKEEDGQDAAANTNKDVVLKLKKSDIQLGVYYEFQLVLDCDLAPEDVTWSSEHPHIAKVDEQGNVTAVKEGTTAITAKYGDQEVQCIVRCIWY